MKSLITIMAHKDAQETFNRHFPIWKALEADIIVAYPNNSKVLLPEKSPCMTLEVGKAAHTGVESIIRLRTILERMCGTGYDRYAFFEYDALAFEWPDMKAYQMAAPVFHDNSPGRAFIGTKFCHPPLFFTERGLSTLVKEIQEMPMDAEQSVWDRWIGLAVERSGLMVLDLLTAGLALSDNTIHPPRFKELARVTRNGAIAFHGVKTPECLKVILEARAVREAAKVVIEAGGEVGWKD